jgi:membrane-bound metal-dependent hydrolase YbcI (DUF457 family)
MKGLTHFLAGIAAASFVPGVIEGALNGSYLIVLGGIFGLLPDTLDFKFARYFDRAEAIDPDPANLDPQAIADQIAALIDRAALTNREVRAQLHTIKLGPDRWRQYTVRFDADRHEVAVRVGPIVNTSQMPIGVDDRSDWARATVAAKLNYTYDGDINVDIFGGPSFGFVPKANGVEIQFLPWHRAWSHSFTLAALLGLITGVLFGSLQAGLVAFFGMSAHVVEDQLGYLGSNLFWPITQERSAGARLLHSGDAIPNFLAVWTALVLILFNLDRFSAPIQNRASMLTPLVYFSTMLILPALILIGVYAWERRQQHVPRATAQQADIVAELKETEV